MGGERLTGLTKEKRSWAEKYQIFNAVTALASLVLMGVPVGLALAVIDVGQIALIEAYKRRKKKKQ